MTHSDLGAFLGRWLPRLEEELHAALANDEPALALHYGMQRYHLGWVDAELRPQSLPAGKRLRPMLCLLACAEVGGDPVQALPAAAAIELLHNFSLIHDDVEDGDELRRHRPTVWKLWGVPQAINAGDAMFSLAFAAMGRLPRRGVTAAATLDALDRFTQTCLRLTEGQHLDMRFEARDDVTVDDYLRMIDGKTAALIGASVAIGAVVGGAGQQTIAAFADFGRQLGLAFQIQDDILGIWGDPAQTGKAAGNDILRRKKSLPILVGLHHRTAGPPLRRLLDGEPDPAQLPEALARLEAAGARAHAEAAVRAHYSAGMDALVRALGERAEGSALRALAEGLLDRSA